MGKIMSAEMFHKQLLYLKVKKYPVGFSKAGFLALAEPIQRALGHLPTSMAAMAKIN